MREGETNNDSDGSSDGRQDTKGPSVVESLLPAKTPSGSTLGTVGKIILWIGTAVLAASVIFISFLWITAHRAMQGYPVSEAWRVIIESGRLTQSITLSTVVLRLAMGLQGGLMASMLAALTVERYPPSIYRGPEISMMRAATSAKPFELVWSLVAQPVKKSKHQIRVVFLAMGLMVIGAASNFASTILLADLDSGWYVGPIQSATVSVDPSEYQLQDTGSSYINTSPENYPIFGEYTESPMDDLTLKDTGVTIRALPPFGSNERSLLNQYSGYSLLVDSRVVCLHPGKIKDIHLSLDNSMGGFLYVSGVLHTENLLNQASVFLPPGVESATVLDTKEARGRAYPFNCTGIIDAGGGVPGTRHGADWRLTACHLPELGIELRTPLDRPKYFGSNGEDLNFLLVNLTNDPFGWSFAVDRSPNPFMEVHDDHEWRKFAITTKPLNNTMSLTVCMGSFFSNYGNVTMRRGPDLAIPGPRPEPVLARSSWITEGYDTSQIRRLYGATTNDNNRGRIEDRGILDLNNNNAEKSVWANESNYTASFRGVLYNIHPILSPSVDGPSNQSMVSLSLIGPGVSSNQWIGSKIVALHRSLISLVQDILAETRNPALALQTLCTIVVQRAYYDSLELYSQDDADTRNEVLVGFTPSATMPVGWGGYVTVMAIVGIHLVLLCIITTMFMRMTKSSRLGDFWATFGQTCDETDERVRAILEEVEDVSDDNVKRWVILKDRNQMDTLSQGRVRKGETV